MSGKTEQERRAPITLAVVWKEKTKRKRSSPKLTPEARQRCGDRMRALWADPEWRAKRLAGILAHNAKRWADESYREKELKRLRSYEQKRMALSRLGTAEKVKDPEYVASLSERAKAMWRAGKFDGLKLKQRSAQGQANVSAAVKRYHDRKRGFAVPRLVKSQYDNLVKVKKLTAREAGRVLGLI